MEVEDLKSGKKSVIGSLAFPGKNLVLSDYQAIFLEQYNAIINFGSTKLNSNDTTVIAYKELPVVRLSIFNIQVNGRKIIPLAVKTYHNGTHHPDQSKIQMPMPLLSKVKYNKETGEINYEVGNLEEWKIPSTPD